MAIAPGLTTRDKVAVRDRIIADARSLPDLVAMAQTADPALAKQLTGKALWTAKSPPGMAIGAIIGWVAAKYGLGWDANTVDLVSLVVAVLAAYAMRVVTFAPIATLFHKPTAPLEPK